MKVLAASWFRRRLTAPLRRLRAGDKDLAGSEPGDV
jgi:hypothetical protein